MSPIRSWFESRRTPGRRSTACWRIIAAVLRMQSVFLRTAKVVRSPPYDQLNSFRKHALHGLIVARPPRSAAFVFDPLANGTRRRGGLAKRIDSLTIPDGRPSVAPAVSRQRGKPYDRPAPYRRGQDGVIGHAA
jgi:hypothetical protein